MKKNVIFYLIFGVAIAAAVICLIAYARKSTDVTFTQTETLTTPTRLEKIREIGEWEFMTLHDEEIVDTTAVTKRIWPLPDKKKQLVRIYAGTLRIGFDLRRDTVAGWLRESGDTVRIKLPKVHLLDERFIDEAATRPLIEEGEWSHADRDRLYYKAAKKMKARCLNADNLNTAQGNAREQVEQLMHAVGFTTVIFE